MSELKQRLLKNELARLGFQDAQYDKKQDAMLANPSDKRAIVIKDDASVSYYAEHDHLSFGIHAAAEKVNEVAAMWERAPAVPVEGLSNFRTLAEYNNVVLAARDDSELGYGEGLHFVTWEYAADRRTLVQGNYATDYEAAKENLAVRSGLVNRYKMFNETELKLILQGLVYLGSDYPSLTAEEMANVGKLIGKVKIIAPEISDHEYLEHQALVPDDGLEI
ncbi:MAG: hypothetical protein LBC79_04510 [Deltaproteobacteria bacterium]|jgi:hypothetical protein|nr:hypothetical protein [Deltaproteobacteria bacterium]